MFTNMETPLQASRGADIEYGNEISAISAGVGKTINCGFKPKYIFFSLQYYVNSTWVQVCGVYDSSNPSSFIQMYNNTDTSREIPNTSFLGIGDVTDTGFTIVNPSYQIKNVYWLATS